MVKILKPMPDRKFDEWVKILENHKVNGKYFKLTIQSRNLARNAKPGQFLNILIQPTQDPFLRRPFSYYRVRKDRIEILYEILGRGTAILAQKKKGAVLKALGPLGKPFTSRFKNKKRVLIAGGVGVPPLVFLAEKYPVDYLLIGTKSKTEVLPKKELRHVKGCVVYSTNDGSYGTKGYVTKLLEAIIKKESPKNIIIQTCGPTIMMQAVMDVARRESIEGEASLDKDMACGLGVCLGCMVKTHEGWKASCTEGPVFPFSSLVEA